MKTIVPLSLMLLITLEGIAIAGVVPDYWLPGNVLIRFLGEFPYIEPDFWFRDRGIFREVTTNDGDYWNFGVRLPIDKEGLRWTPESKILLVTEDTTIVSEECYFMASQGRRIVWQTSWGIDMTLNYICTYFDHKRKGDEVAFALCVRFPIGSTRGIKVKELKTEHMYQIHYLREKGGERECPDE